MNTQSWLGRMTLQAVGGVVALTFAALAAHAPSAAQAMPRHEDRAGRGDAHHGADADHRTQSGGDNDGNRDHHSPHHFGGRPNGIYYICT